MTKKIFILIIGIGLLNTSCQSQADFDLSQITLKEHINELPLEKIEVKKKDFFLSPEYATYTIFDNKILTYYNVNLEGRINPKRNFKRNRVLFCFAKKDSIVTMLEIDTYTLNESEKLLEVLNRTLGHPNYTHYKDIHEKAANNPNNLVWEDVAYNKTYFVEIKKSRAAGSKDKRAHLYIVNHSEKFLFDKIISIPGYQYYSDYIDERNRKGDTAYTYQQFVIDETKGGSEYYEQYTK